MLKSFLKNTLKNIGKVAIGSLVFLLLIEVSIRVVYSVRNSRVEFVPIPYMVRNFGLVPPWADGQRILEPDDTMMFRGRPYASRKYLDLFCPMPSDEERKAMLLRFSPSIPEALKNNPVWEVKLNSEGFRDEEFPGKKTAKTLRIVCLGDSWTFGHNANANQTYAHQLGVLLKRDYPDADIEVLNLGMLNYTSYEGLELLQKRGLSLDPDVVLIGYGMNDSAISGWRDKDVFIARPKRFRLKKFILEHSELYKLLIYLGQVKNFESMDMSKQLKAIADPKQGFTYETWVSADVLEAQDYERLEPRVRVSPADYEKNIREMIRLVRGRGAVPILLHNELRPGSPYQSALQRISREQDVALVDTCELLVQAKLHIEAELEQRLGLRASATLNKPTVPGNVEFVFRIYAGDLAVPRAINIAGPLPQLGDAVPNKIAMYDDGTHGDEKAGDQVWSLAVTFSPGQKIFYLYTNSGAEGKWQNLDVPKVRSRTVPATGGRVYGPVESFGKLYLQADASHTNAEGYQLMAQAIRDALVKSEKVRSMTHH